MKKRHFNLSFGLAVTLTAFSFGASAQTRAGLQRALGDGQFDLPWTAQTMTRAKSVFNAGADKVDPALLAVANDVQSKGIGSLDASARQFGVATEGGMVAMTLIAETEGDTDAIERRVRALGGQVTTIYGNNVFALMPPRSIRGLGQLDELYAAIRPAMFYPDYQGSGGSGSLVDGVNKINADKLHARGQRGRGVKVGILDFGFEKYTALQATGIVPKPAAQQSFKQDGTMESDTEHGTACTEIVHAMAPDATVYLAAVDGRVDQIVQAALWLKSQQVDIISFSGGGHYGPHDGRSLLDQLVGEITKDGRTLWVNAAGNEADQHWAGEVPANATGWVITGPNRNVIGLAPRGSKISVLVNWNDWGDDPNKPSATQDLDAVLFLLDRATGNTTQVGQSLVQQNGRFPPIEDIEVPAQPGQIYLLALRATHVTRALRVHVYSNAGALMDPELPSESIGIPATAPSALAVGAVDVLTDKLETYSGRGPTDDNRQKPELSSYDNVRSFAYGQTAGNPGRFPGTSAACPHVAGLAALLKGMQPNASAADLRKLLLSALRQPGTAEPGFGAGLTDVTALVNGNGGGGGVINPNQTVDLPSPLGGRVPAAALEELLRQDLSGRPFDVKVRVARQGDPPVYRVGDDLRLAYKTAEDSYCSLVNRNAEGEFTVLPLDNPQLRGGQPYEYPDSIQISEPTGREAFLMLCARGQGNVRNWRRDVASGAISFDVTFYEVRK
jgi:subtilisin family serine protease